MAYFLRKSSRPKGLYLQICFSYRDPNYPTPRQKSYKTYGYASDLIASGIEDPISYLNGIVDELNEEYRSEKEQRKVRQISKPLRKESSVSFRRLPFFEDWMFRKTSMPWLLSAAFSFLLLNAFFL